MKKILSILCLITVILTAAAFVGIDSFAAETVTQEPEYGGYPAGQFIMASESLCNELINLADEDIQTVIASGDPILSAGVKQWAELKDTLGEYKVMNSGVVTEADGIVTTEVGVEYANGTIYVSVAYDTTGTQPVLSSLGVSTQSMASDGSGGSLGETMKRAGLNTLMGIGTVFVILILISGLISCFGYIYKWETNNKNKKAGQSAAAQPVKVQPAAEAAALAVEEETVDDLEVVAAITAAIAASMNTSTDGFVVRSIKKRNRMR